MRVAIVLFAMSSCMFADKAPRKEHACASGNATSGKPHKKTGCDGVQHGLGTKPVKPKMKATTIW